MASLDSDPEIRHYSIPINPTFYIPNSFKIR